MPLSVEVTQYVSDFIEENVYSERVYAKIIDAMRICGAYPEVGRAYEPDYPAAQPPVPCRCFAVPDTPFSFYYFTAEDESKLVIFYIENQAMDPRTRFTYAGIDF